MKPEKGKLWAFLHLLDYGICRILCPGTDGLDYFLYRFYELDYGERRKFITEGDLSVMVKAFNGDKKSRDWDRFNNKVRFNKEFAAYIGRSWIDDDIGEDEFRQFCRNTGKLILKPAGGAQGKGVFFAEPKTDDEISELYRKIHKAGYIIEEVIKQNEKLAALHPQSVNTVRIYTTRSLKDASLHVTGAVIRIGRGNSNIDNYSSGGMVAEIDPDSGVVISRAVDEAGNEYLTHPDTGVDIMGFEVPEWKGIREMALKAHAEVRDLGYIAWDVAVRADMQIIFLEANLYGGVHMQQQPSMTGKKELYRSLMF